MVVTGPTGSGKSTTLAAMIHRRNQERADHIITLEDPLEFLHDDIKCLIHQREMGRHAKSFATALRAALREDPNGLLVGEMRDLETIGLAMTAAEMGLTVLGTLHTQSAAKTVDRIIDAFPADQHAQARAAVALLSQCPGQGLGAEGAALHQDGSQGLSVAHDAAPWCEFHPFGGCFPTLILLP